MPEWLTYLGQGVLFGLAGGLTPGPTSVLVITQTLRHGLGDGIKVAIGPLLTDAPIIVIAVLLVGRLAEFEWVLATLGVCGAAFLARLAWETWHASGTTPATAPDAPHSIRRGMLVNILNPHPYIFWFAVGAPILLEAWGRGVDSAAMFLVGQYVCLVGAKVLVAALTARSRTFFRSPAYRWISRILAVVLAAYAVAFLLGALDRLR